MTRIANAQTTTFLKAEQFAGVFHEKLLIIVKKRPSLSNIRLELDWFVESVTYIRFKPKTSNIKTFDDPWYVLFEVAFNLDDLKKEYHDIPERLLKKFISITKKKLKLSYVAVVRDDSYYEDNVVFDILNLMVADDKCERFISEFAAFLENSKERFLNMVEKYDQFLENFFE